MSDLLIKNMEIPRNCVNCKIPNICKPYQKVKTGNKVLLCCQQRLPDCPLIELAEHGDLIDKHRLLEKLRELIDEIGVLDRKTDMYRIVELVENSPTILSKS